MKDVSRIPTMGTVTARKKKFAILDGDEIDRLLRKAAFCQAFVDSSKLEQVRNFITRDLVLQSDSPLVVRSRAGRMYSRDKSTFADLIKDFDVSGITEFLEKKLSKTESNRKKIEAMQRKVANRRRNNATWLMLGQGAVALVGAAAGLGLAVLTFGGALTVIAGQTAAFGLQIGASKVAFGAAGFGLRQAVNISHSWSCLLYTSPSPRDQRGSRMPSSA